MFGNNKETETSKSLVSRGFDMLSISELLSVLSMAAVVRFARGAWENDL